jgi:hypothetical protein
VAGRALAVLLLSYPAATDALAPNEWRIRQPLEVPQSGLVRVSLPAETLDAARPGMEDLRIVDPSGREVPYVIDRPLPQPETTLRPKEFHVLVEGAVTRINMVTGTMSVLRAVSLEAPGTGEFIKPVRVEGSHDGRNWQQLADHEPVFRMAGGATKLRVPFPEGAWEFLRLSVDDGRSAPAPFTGAELSAGEISAPAEPMAVTIKSRDENPGVTRLALNLEGLNLTPAKVQIETTEALFARNVTVAVPQVSGDDIKEQVLATSVIYRIDAGGKAETRLEVPIDRQVKARELLLLIANGDSPPLPIKAIRAERRAVYVMFSAFQPGRYALLTGNSQCASPNYDLSVLAKDLKGVQGKPARPAGIERNPDYQAADTLAAVSLTGGKIDVAPWGFRKSVRMTGPGTQEVELDLDVLARATRDLRDVRLVRDDRQIPFLLERTSISRALPMAPGLANDPKKPNISRWSLKLPRAGLPISRIVCTPSPGVFQREFHLSETVTDGVREDYAVALGSTTWAQRPDEKPRDILFELNTPPMTDTLILETDNGDNPPIQLNDFRAYYPVTRVIFRSSSVWSAPTWLYYGDRDASAPHYDVSLVANELLRSERLGAAIGREEVLKASVAGDTLAGASRYIFWGVLGLVVVGLLFVVARFLPKAG